MKELNNYYVKFHPKKGVVYSSNYPCFMKPKIEVIETKLLGVVHFIYKN